jgi:hypothetical protein
VNFASTWAGAQGMPSPLQVPAVQGLPEFPARVEIPRAADRLCGHPRASGEARNSHATVAAMNDLARLDARSFHLRLG